MGMSGCVKSNFFGPLVRPEIVRDPGVISSFPARPLVTSWLRLRFMNGAAGSSPLVPWNSKNEAFRFASSTVHLISVTESRLVSAGSGSYQFFFLFQTQRHTRKRAA